MTWGMVAVAGATLVAGAVNSNATSKAASGAQNAAKDANSLQWNMFQQNQNNQRPWIQTGQSALGALSSGMGLNGAGNFNAQQFMQDRMSDQNAPWAQGASYSPQDAYNYFLQTNGDPTSAANSKYFDQSGAGFGSLSKDFSMADYQSDPGYQFRLDQGQKALERAGAAKGMTLSGAQAKGLTDYNSGMASQEYGNAYNRFMQNRTTKFGELSNLAGLGQSSVGQIGQAGMNTAGTMGNNTMGAATVSANAGLSNASNWTNALNNGVNTWQQYNAMNNGTGTTNQAPTGGTGGIGLGTGQFDWANGWGG